MSRIMANAIKHNLNMSSIQPPQITVTVIDGKYQYSGTKELIEVVRKALEAKEPEYGVSPAITGTIYSLRQEVERLREALNNVTKKYDHEDCWTVAYEALAPHIEGK